MDGKGNMKNKKQKQGYTKQGVLDLNFIKGKPKGIRLDFPPDMDAGCTHPLSAIYVDKDGDKSCKNCRTMLS
jgi:hypothetical protein